MEKTATVKLTKTSHTANYTPLTALYNKYSDQGLKILAFPCNQFGGQEPVSQHSYHSFVILCPSIHSDTNC